LQVRAYIKEFDAYRVKDGQKVQITSDALDSITSVSGTVSKISALATTNRNLSGEETVVEAIISIDGSSDVFIPGLSATCKIIAAKKVNAVVISYVSIKEDKDGSKSVFIVDETGQIVNRLVKLGVSSEMNVEVLEGLNEGDLVVTNWQPSFKTGDKAKIID
jgi:HlyD family secretion protein